MADWDPLGEPDLGAEGQGDVANGLPGPSSEALPIQGSDHLKISKKDMERMLLDLSRRFNRESPWTTMPEPQPDLRWHTPTCTLEDWKHTDVKVKLGPGIAYVTLNKPEDNNTLSDGVIAGLCDAVVSLHGRQDIRIVVFSGEGKMLCAGRDPRGDNYGFNISPTPTTQKSFEEQGQEALKAGAFPDGKLNIGRLLQGRLWQAWSTLPQFTITVANGSALGDGIGCVVCSDVAIALKTAFFGFSDTKMGLVNAGISRYLLAKTSAGAAKNMFVLGEVLPAESAREKGIVNRVVESMAEGHKVVAEMCEEITKCGPRTVQLAKEVVEGVAGRQVDETILFYTMLAAAAANRSEEARQGVAATAGDTTIARTKKPWEAVPIAPLA